VKKTVNHLCKKGIFQNSCNSLLQFCKACQNDWKVVPMQVAQDALKEAKSLLKKNKDKLPQQKFQKFNSVLKDYKSQLSTKEAQFFFESNSKDQVQGTAAFNNLVVKDTLTCENLLRVNQADGSLAFRAGQDNRFGERVVSRVPVKINFTDPNGPNAIVVIGTIAADNLLIRSDTRIRGTLNVNTDIQLLGSSVITNAANVGYGTGNTLNFKTLAAGTNVTLDTSNPDQITISASGSGMGDVTGPSISTDNAIAKFNGTTGKIIQNSDVIIDSSNNISGANNLTINGNFSGNISGVSSSAVANATTKVQNATNTATPNTLMLRDSNANSQVATPLAAPDIATKGYVDAVAQGLTIKPPVKALANSNISPLTGPKVIDGVSVDAGDRVLLISQTSGIDNGIWLVQSGPWIRPTDFPNGYHADGTFVFVEEGTTFANTGWVCTTPPPTDVVGTDPLTFVQFSGPGTTTGQNLGTGTGQVYSGTSGNVLEFRTLGSTTSDINISTTSNQVNFTANSSTSATPNTLVLRNSNANFQSATPIANADVATKDYVDSSSNAVTFKTPVIAVATTAIASLSGTGQVVDGVTLAAGNRVLLTAQSPRGGDVNNGIWVVESGTWTRPTDFQDNQEASATVTFVERGTSFASTGWICTSQPPADIIGRNQLAYVQFSAKGLIAVTGENIGSGTGQVFAGTSGNTLQFNTITTQNSSQVLSVSTDNTNNVVNLDLNYSSSPSVNKLVQYDSSGNITANTFNGNLNGTANSATFFTGSLNGDVTGTQSSTTVSNVPGSATINGQPASNYVYDSVDSSPTATNVPVFTGTNKAVKQTGVTIDSNNNIVTAGNLNLTQDPSTTTAGMITKGLTPVPFIHNLNSDSNFFAGINAGNLSGTGISNTCVGNAALATGSGDHNTALGFNALTSNTANKNVAIGSGALQSNVIQVDNTAVGYQALQSVVSGSQNTAIGSGAGANLTSSGNTAIGFNSLPLGGSGNTAIGGNALSLITGDNNTAIGHGAGQASSAGSNNISIGISAASGVTSGSSNNIHIFDQGLSADSAVIKIGTQGTQTGGTFIAGIHGGTAPSANTPVYIDANGKLSDTSNPSSKRYKRDITDINDLTNDLYKLRPVKFKYNKDFDPSEKIQYGLIAEEVDLDLTRIPEMVIHKDGQPEAVNYNILPILLLNELKKLRTKINVQEEEIKKHNDKIDQQEKQISQLMQQIAIN
jgi:hypothetical protein